VAAATEDAASSGCDLLIVGGVLLVMFSFLLPLSLPSDVAMEVAWSSPLMREVISSSNVAPQ